MRVFGRDATEIAPHAADEVRDLGLGKPGKGAADVVPSMLGNAEKGANAARQRAADGGSAVERQKLEQPKKNAAPQASRRSASRGALTEKFGRARVIELDRLNEETGLWERI